jgi:hypothetical protein
MAIAAEVKQSKADVKEILDYANRSLGLSPLEYNRLEIKNDDGSLAGVLFHPYRPHEKTVFVPKDRTPGHEIKGTRREVDKALIRSGIDPDVSERIMDEDTADWRAHHHYPS